MNTPVLLLIFNRPETTTEVFQKIRAARPSRLYIAADGPRIHLEDEPVLCEKVRRIATDVDWECELKTQFQKKNIGCKNAVHAALDWFFEHEELGIILEDDCLPDHSFFWFCEEMLKMYYENSQVMMISGSNFQKINSKKNSYFFSRYPNIWGWATWRRAWQHYDITMALWPEFSRGKLFGEMFDRRTFRFWQNVFKRAYQNEINFWDYQWIFSCFVNGGLSIVPSVNLVSNIGHFTKGTHTNKYLDPYLGFPLSSIKSPLVHPKEVKINCEYDIMFQKVQNPRTWIWLIRILRYLSHALFQKNTSIKKAFRDIYTKIIGRLQ